jgi:hypothetical protein
VIELAADGVLRRFATELAAPAPAVALGEHADVDREAARLVWATRIFDEYRSVAIFSELLHLLADLEAPFAALCAVQQLIGDELRHTRMTAEVVEWLGGTADLAIDLREVGLPPREPGESRAERALRIVGRELVCVEEESVYALAAYRDATTEPAVRAVLARILADEARHAAVGRALFAWFDEAARASIATELAADRADLRATYARSARGGPGRALGASITLADLERIWARSG